MTIFIAPLAQDSRIWEILGTRNITFDEKLSKVQAEVYCYSTSYYPPKRKNTKFKVFNISVRYLKYLAAGSRWRHGVELKLGSSAFHVGDILTHNCDFIPSKETLTKDQLINKLKRSKNVYLTSLNSVNYLRYEDEQGALYIPCSEVIRHFFAPSQRFLTLVLTGKLEDTIDPQKRHEIKFKPLDSEIRMIEFITSCVEILSAARYPYKAIKLTHIKNILRRENLPFLLSARLPVSGILPIWSYGTQPVHTSKGRAFVVTNLESEPQHIRARRFRERYPMKNISPK